MHLELLNSFQSNPQPPQMMFATALVLFISCARFVLVQSMRIASVHEVQPSHADVVHTVWLNGPAHTGKAQWVPKNFNAKKTTECTTFDDKFTGYTTTGQYCAPSTTTLDDQPHLLIYSGRMSVVLDAGGINGEPASRNLIPKLGSLSQVSQQTAATMKPKEIYDATTLASADISLITTCSGGDGTATTKYFLGTEQTRFVPIGLVRQGHVVTQVTLSSLVFHDEKGLLFGPCSQFQPVVDPNPTSSDNGSPNCNGSPKWGCTNPTYPKCVGFVQGSSWGKCHSICTAAEPTMWMEVSAWGDSLSIRLKWDAPFAISDGCVGEIKMSVTSDDGTVAGSRAITLGSTNQPVSGAEVSLHLEVHPDDNQFKNVKDLSDASDTIHKASVTMVPNQKYSNGHVLRRPATRDNIVEVPTNLPKCGYNKDCAKLPLMTIPIEIMNGHENELRTVRLVFSRKFQTRSKILLQSQPSAEITGFSAQLFSNGMPTGIPCQISKNWHSGNTDAEWAGFDGTWWAVNCLLRLPPNTKMKLSLGINYEKYGGVNAFSHAQLSIVGYSDKWLWEEAALGTSGENICFDPLGSHTRAFITDVRPKLFDGQWKENVGGGDFLLFWGGETGELKYLKSLDPIIRSNGPCLSNASYVSVTEDDAIQSNIEISGGRTDDLVRVFIHQRLDVVKNIKFSRLAFFQFGSETYNYRALFDQFIVGASGGETATHQTYQRICTSGPTRTNTAKDKMYVGGPFREQMPGQAPWWISSGANTDSVVLGDTTTMVAGDRGLVIRSYDAIMGGKKFDAPTFSILCDKIEIGTPADLFELQVGDYIDMKLEIIIVPRVGKEYDAAVENSNSKTLTKLAKLPTSWEKIRAQSEGGRVTLEIKLPGRATIESSYPIRVCATGTGGGANMDRAVGDTGVLFEVSGASLSNVGFVPVVICNLLTHDIPNTESSDVAQQRGLWLDVSTDGSNSWVLLNQETTTGTRDFWQVNYDRQHRKYEYVFNIEFSAAKTRVAFGSRPDTWPATPPPPVTTPDKKDGDDSQTTDPDTPSKDDEFGDFTNSTELTSGCDKLQPTFLMLLACFFMSTLFFQLPCV